MNSPLIRAVKVDSLAIFSLHSLMGAWFSSILCRVQMLSLSHPSQVSLSKPKAPILNVPAPMQIIQGEVASHPPLVTRQSHNDGVSISIRSEFLNTGVVAVEFKQGEFFDLIYRSPNPVRFHPLTFVY
jgi:hypothetical protein